MSKIKKIKTFKSKVTLTLEDNTKIDVDKNVFPDFYLYVGKNLTKKEIAEINKSNDAASLLQYALKLRQKNAYTEYRMREKLYDKGGKKDQIDIVIKKLKHSGLINDKKYIEDYIEYYNSLNYGKNKIVSKLMDKGIFKETLDRLVFPKAIELKKANKNLKHFENKYSKYNDAQKKQHIYQAYIADGFDVDIAKEMVNEVKSNTPSDEKKKLDEDFEKVYRKYRVKYKKKDLRTKLISALAGKGYKINDIINLIERKHL